MKKLATAIVIVHAAVGGFVGLSMVADAYGPTVATAVVLAVAFFVGTSATGDL